MRPAIAALAVAAALSAAPLAMAAGTVPEWVRDTASHWADGQISDGEFLDAVTFLVESGIITITGEGAEVASEAPIAGPERPEGLSIGLIPVEKGKEITAEAGALASFLEGELGIPVEIRFTTDYETVIQGMEFGHLDAAFMDAGPAWITHSRTGAEVVLAELVDGKISYQATVWALEGDDAVQSLGDTVGKRVAFTSITGSSGFVRPVGTLVAEGQIEVDGGDIVALERALQDGFEAHTFAGGYKAALELLLEGHVDAAFGSDIAPAKHLPPEDRARLRAADTVGPVPSHVFVVQRDMPGHVREEIVAAMVKLNTDEHNGILRGLYGADALVPTTTAMHIGDFGPLIDGLSGLDQKILDKYDKSK